MEFPTKTVHLPHLAGGIDFDVVAGDLVIGPAIEQGSWADHEVALMRAHLEPGARVVDLGANVGWFAVHAVLAGAEVDAFEPVPALADIARRNVERAMARPGAGRGRVHAVAGGAERGQAQIALAGDNHGDNRVLDGDEHPGGADDAVPDDMTDSSELVTIEIAPVDEFVEGPVRFLKVDTQGSEWLALQGARKLLAASPQLAMLLELWPYALRETTADGLLAFLFEQGFSVGKATEAPFPMSKERILRQVMARDPVHGGIDLYAVRGRPFHVLGLGRRLHGMARSLREP